MFETLVVRSTRNNDLKPSLLYFHIVKFHWPNFQDGIPHKKKPRTYGAFIIYQE